MTGKRLGLLSVTGALLALFLTACGADPTATPAPTATPPPEATAAPTPDAAALFEIEWAALIAAAQAEGEIVMTFGGSAGRNYRPIVEVWGEKFGVTPIMATGSGSAHVNRVLSEQIAGRYLVDVMYGGASSVNTRMIPANALDPVAPLLIHPEVIDQSLWFGGRHWYADPEQKYIFTFAASASPMTLGMRYNTDLVTPEDVEGFTSVYDFLDPKWKGQIVSLAPGSGGAGGTYYTAFVHPGIGTDWIDGFLSPELDVTFVDDRRFIADGVAKGKFAMAIGSALRDLDALGELGAPIKPLLKNLKEGGVLSASSSLDLMTIPTKRPNPNASKLWANWWLSKEGQTLMHTLVEVDPDPTLRLDITDFGVTPKEFLRVEGQSYFFFDTDPELTAKRSEAAAYAAAVYAANR